MRTLTADTTRNLTCLNSLEYREQEWDHLPLDSLRYLHQGLVEKHAVVGCGGLVVPTTGRTASWSTNKESACRMTVAVPKKLATLCSSAQHWRKNSAAGRHHVYFHYHYCSQPEAVCHAETVTNLNQRWQHCALLCLGENAAWKMSEPSFLEFAAKK